MNVTLRVLFTMHHAQIYLGACDFVVLVCLQYSREPDSNVSQSKALTRPSLGVIIRLHSFTKGAPPASSIQSQQSTTSPKSSLLYSVISTSCAFFVCDTPTPASKRSRPRHHRSIAVVAHASFKKYQNASSSSNDTKDENNHLGRTENKPVRALPSGFCLSCPPLVQKQKLSQRC